MNKTALIKKLNEIFDISGAVVTKTQTCRKGRWLCSLGLTLFFSAVFSLLVWGAVRYLHGSLVWFLIILLSVILLFMLLRVWIAAAADARGARFAERCVTVRRGDERYCYTRSKYTVKFEYGGGLFCLCGGEVEKMPNKGDYSRLAERYSKSLQRRSSMYNTLTPSFWADVLGEMDVREENGCIIGEDGSRRVTLSVRDGKISSIDYLGKSYYLFDSLSPVRALNGKFVGKYSIRYEFRLADVGTVKCDRRFKEGISEYLLVPPKTDLIEFCDEIPFAEWIAQTDALPSRQTEFAPPAAPTQAQNRLSVDGLEPYKHKDGYISAFANMSGERFARTAEVKSRVCVPEGEREGNDKSKLTTVADIYKCGALPPIAAQNANYRKLQEFDRPYLAKTGVVDGIKLMKIYGEENKR